MSLPSTDDTTIEAVAKALHDRWQNDHRSWDETCAKLPLQAENFREEARLAFATIRAMSEGTAQKLQKALTEIQSIVEEGGDLEAVSQIAKDATSPIA